MGTGRDSGSLLGFGLQNAWVVATNEWRSLGILGRPRGGERGDWELGRSGGTLNEKWLMASEVEKSQGPLRRSLGRA